MNFAFSEEQLALQEQARAWLRREAAGSARRPLEARSGFDAALWAQAARLGWPGAAIPEALGGSGLGEEGVCVLAEALGGSLAAVPFFSGAVVAGALLRFGDAGQQARWLPGLADGSAIGALALGEPVRIGYRDGRLEGEAWPVADGGIATLALVAARDATGEVGLYVAGLEGAARERLETLDPSRDTARIRLDGVTATRLAGGASAVALVLERAAVLCAFEQLGGAQAALEMACAYARERQAFGRPIGSFQAIKHKLADVYVAIELARSNAYYAAWALGCDAPELPVAAAAARVAAIRAFELAAQENIQVHGGMGFTWESDCHLFYRRAKYLSLLLGAAPFWKDRLVGGIERRNAA